MTYQEALSYIHSVSWKGSVPGLSRTRELLVRLGNPQEKLKFVHIAGTNGKGSTAAMLASIFRAAGYRTGLYTSPFILCFNERMQVDGEMISDEELAEITEFVRPHAEAMQDHPTEFELVTAIAMVYFMRHKCDIVSLEVGLGGELDSTNVISTPEASVICNIGLDHTEVLGDTLEKIASAKAGIIKGGDAVIYRGKPSVEQVFADACARTGARLHKADFDGIHLKHADFTGQVFDLGARKDLEIPLLGEHQLKNAAVVVATVDALTAKGVPELTMDNLARVIELWTKIPASKIREEEFKRLSELDQRLKNFIAAEKKHGRKITQKEFVIGLIEQALDAYEAQNQPAEMSEE